MSASLQEGARKGKHNGTTHIIQIKEAVLIDEGLSAFGNGLVRTPRSGQEVTGDELVDHIAELCTVVTDIIDNL